MNISEDEFMEWHEHVMKQRKRYKCFIENILTGVPTIHGMASEYKQLTLAEIKERARNLLNDHC